MHAAVIGINLISTTGNNRAHAREDAMEDMQSWTQVVTDPLGLVGFVLFLVFGFLAKVGLSRDQRWLAMAAVAMAFVVLVGGLALSWMKTRPAVSPPPSMSASTPPPTQAAPAAPTAPASTSTQTTHGAQSPAVQGVQGDVTIKIDGDKSKE